MDFVERWQPKTGIAKRRFIRWLGIASSKFYDWTKRYGKENAHNGRIPRDFWLEDWERQAILDFQREFPLEGYRRLTFMMLDRDLVAVSPTTTWRVLHQAGRLKRWNTKSRTKGRGFHQPLGPHQHWHVDISYINVCGTFYYLITVLDGYSRYVCHWDLRESMTERDVEIVLQAARELYPDARPRIISDNGPQFIAKDFKVFIRLAGMTHVRTSPYYPQANGKCERWHGTLKGECIRLHTPLTLADAKRLVTHFVHHYNHVRLHSAIGYVPPAVKLAGREAAIFRARDRKLEEARTRRRQKRAALRARKPGEPLEAFPHTSFCRPSPRPAPAQGAGRGPATFAERR